MKKTISINIGGIIFHIEEDGYEKLKGYLASIQKYFSSFADSKEIVSDIEGRVAERFVSKQKSENKQVISLADVDELIAAMGTVADFEAIETAEHILADPLETTSAGPAIHQAPTSPPPPRTEQTKTTTGPKKLVRDLRRKLLGGVAAGLAHNFSVDPIWVRLAFLFAVIGLPAGSGILGMNLEDEFGSFSGLVVLIYIAMWVAFPGSATLEEDTQIKKFYRDPDRKVVGGVAAGVASYFGVDLGVVRFLWVISILFFGTGLIIYIVLWVIAPVANTLTEKMEMQGEPITLSNIESNIKQSLNLDEKTGEEHIVTKILLFPFRAIALVIGALGRLLKGLGPILRIMIGAMLIGMSVISLIALVIAGGVALGLTSTMPFDGLPIPFMIFNELPGILILSGILVAAVPLVTFLLLGLTLLSNKRIVGGSVWLTLLGLWIVGIVGSTIGGVSYQRNFAKRGEVTQYVNYPIPAGTLTLEYENVHDEETIDVDIRLQGSNKTDSIGLVKTMYARGRTREDARHNAEMLQYDVTLSDSVMRFNEGPVFDGKGRFREQRVEASLSIPYNKPFIMTREFYFSLNRWELENDINRKYNLEDWGIKWNNLRWVMLRDSGLICTNLPAKYFHTEDENEETDTRSFEEEYNSELNLGERGTYIKQFPVADFNKIDLGGAYSIIIRQGAEFNVSADAQTEQDIDDLRIYVENGTLRAKRNQEFNLFSNDDKRIGLVITMPTIESLSLSGANKTLLAGFTGLPKLDVEISGASKSEINVDVVQLNVSVSGASKATLKGSAKTASLEAHGACKLNAEEMNIETADVDASGASKVDLGAVKNLDRHASGASKISARE